MPGLMTRPTERDLDQHINDKLSCPPCNGRCDQGRSCPATAAPQPAEAATELGQDDDDLVDPRAAALFWTAYLLALAMFAAAGAACWLL